MDSILEILMARRSFTKEFKIDAVRKVTQFGAKSAQVARDLDIHEGVLRKWIKELARDPLQAFPGKGHLRLELLEIASLRREVAKLKAERDMFQNAAIGRVAEALTKAKSDNTGKN